MGHEPTRMMGRVLMAQVMLLVVAAVVVVAQEQLPGAPAVLSARKDHQLPVAAFEVSGCDANPVCPP